MARIKQTVTLHRGCTLDLGEPPSVRILAGGQHWVLKVRRRRASRFLTYDTGLIEALYVEMVEDIDWNNETIDIADWHCAAYVRGGMRLGFLSTSARGRIVLRRLRRRRLFRAPVFVHAGTARMTFDRPRVDRENLGQIEIDWSIEISAPEPPPA